jgi:hypothetical protein
VRIRKRQLFKSARTPAIKVEGNSCGGRFVVVEDTKSEIGCGLRSAYNLTIKDDGCKKSLN